MHGDAHGSTFTVGPGRPTRAPRTPRGIAPCESAVHHLHHLHLLLLLLHHLLTQAAASLATSPPRAPPRAPPCHAHWTRTSPAPPRTPQAPSLSMHLHHLLLLLPTLPLTASTPPAAAKTHLMPPHAGRAACRLGRPRAAACAAGATGGGRSLSTPCGTPRTPPHHCTHPTPAHAPHIPTPSDAWLAVRSDAR